MRNFDKNCSLVIYFRRFNIFTSFSKTFKGTSVSMIDMKIFNSTESSTMFNNYSISFTYFTAYVRELYAKKERYVSKSRNQETFCKG